LFIFGADFRFVIALAVVRIANEETALFSSLSKSLFTPLAVENEKIL
jgi:hypothetical protein